MNITLKAILIATLVLVPLTSQAAVQQLVGGSLVGATGVDVNGDIYDVEFFDGTLASVFGSSDPADFDFHSSADAVTAAQALIDQVFTGLVDDEPEITLGITSEAQSFTHIPYSFSAPGDLGHPFSISARARNHEQEFLDSTLTGIQQHESFNSSIPFSVSGFSGERINWARFTLVPEPGTAGLLLGLGGLALLRWRTA